MHTILHTLANGLKVLIEENHAAPVVSCNIVVNVGSAMETAAEAGISHFIEHMLFKGTPTRAVGQIARDVEGAGGEINAYTSFDQTVYYINMTSRCAEQGLEILADAVQHPQFNAEETLREAEVICEEIRRGADNPSHQLSERMFAEVYGSHPYGRPIIGTADTVKSFRSEHLRDYWQRWYTADNMAFVVVGDIDTDYCIRRAEELFRDLRPTCTGHRPPVAVPVAVAGPRCVQERAQIQSSYFALTTPIPHLTHPDLPALDLLSQILGGGESSRLDQAIKEKRQLVHNIYSYAYAPRGSGIFSVGGMTESAKMPKALPAIWDEICRCADHPATTAEVERARVGLLAGAIYEKETVGGLSGKYAYYLATAGDHTFEERYYARLNELSARDLQDVAQRYLRREHTTLTWIAPKTDKIVAPVQAIKLLKPTDAKNSKVPGPRVPDTALFTCKNGLRCVVRTAQRLPLVSFYATMLGGSRFETAANAGISALVAASLPKGTQSRDAATIAETIDSLAGSLHASTGRNTFGVRGDFLSSKLNEGFALFADVLCHPLFAADEVAKEREQQLHSIHNQQDNLASVASQAFAQALYGKHPYGLPQIGTAASVRTLRPAQLATFYRMLNAPERMVLSLSGDIDVATAKELIDRYLIWPKKSVRVPTVVAMPVVKPQTVYAHRADKQQAHILFGMRGATIKSPDRYALTVLNQILAGQGGRLFLTLRDQMSLAYSVSSSLQLGLEPGYFAVYIGTDPRKVDTAIDGIKTQLTQVAQATVTSEELDRARQHLVGTYDLDLQRNSSVASVHALNVLYNLGLAEMTRYPEEILKITATDVLRVAKKYLRLQDAVCSVVTPKK